MIKRKKINIIYSNKVIGRNSEVFKNNKKDSIFVTLIDKFSTKQIKEKTYGVFIANKSFLESFGGINLIKQFGLIDNRFISEMTEEVGRILGVNAEQYTYGFSIDGIEEIKDSYGNLKPEGIIRKILSEDYSEIGNKVPEFGIKSNFIMETLPIRFNKFLYFNESINEDELGLLLAISSLGAIEYCEIIRKIKGMEHESLILESMIADFYLKKQKLNYKNYDELLELYYDSNTLEIHEKMFYFSNKEGVDFDEDRVNEEAKSIINFGKQNGYIKVGEIKKLIQQVIENSCNLREAFLYFVDFYDQFIIGGFNGINAALIVELFRTRKEGVIFYEYLKS